MHTNVYFAGKLIWAEGAAAVTDRLGSVVSGNRKYFPYGEEPTTTAQDKTKFALYFRDATTALDYADQRYYARTIGRFLTPDPYIASGGPEDPQGWNQYAYVGGDPVNYVDPPGLFRSSAEGGGPQTVCGPFSGNSLCRFTTGFAISTTFSPGPHDPPFPGGWLVEHNRYTAKYRTQTFEAIYGLADGCKWAFAEAGISLNELAASSMRITFWDATKDYEGKLTQHEIVNNNDLTPLGEQPSNWYAYVIPNAAGKPTNHVVLKEGFFNANPLRQGNILVHEALHVYKGMRDYELATQVFHLQTTVQAASGDLQGWLDAGCPRSIGSVRHNPGGSLPDIIIRTPSYGGGRSW
jgi:RHS repeat-associated protein